MTSTYEVLKDFSGPVATILAAAAAATVTIKLGLNQQAIAREQARFAKANNRAAQQKLIMDLFDKRWEIVADLRRAIGEFTRQGKVAKQTKVSPLRCPLAALICIELEKLLGPSKLPRPAKKPLLKVVPKPPRSITRIPEVERNIALGKELAALRLHFNRGNEYSRAVRARFPKLDATFVSKAARVARVFGDRPDVYRRLSWQALVELSSPKISPDVRQALESELLAGKSLAGREIRRARGRLKPGSPKRSYRMPAASLAA